MLNTNLGQAINLDMSGIFFSIIDKFDHPIIILDAKCMILYANQIFIETIGFCSEDLMGLSFFNLVKQEEIKDIRQTFENCIKYNSSGFNLQHKIINGKEGFESFKTNVVLQKNESNQSILILHLQPIKEFIEFIEENKKKELCYEVLAEQVSDSFLAHDFEGRFLVVNEQACKSLRYSKEELLNMSVTDIELDYDLKSAQAEWSKVKPGEGFTLYGRQIRKDGTIFPVEIRFGCSYWKGEKIFLAMCRDITERKKAETELKEKEEFNRLVMDNLPIGIAVNSVFPTVNFVYMNDKFPHIYRVQREQLEEPGSFWEVVCEDADFRSYIKKRVLDDIASGEVGRMMWENIPIVRGGETRYISAYNIPIPGKDLLISTVIDVTDRVVAEQILQQNAGRLQMLHEIDQAILKGFTQLEDIGELAIKHISKLIELNQASVAIFDFNCKDLHVISEINGVKSNTVFMISKADYKRLSILKDEMILKNDEVFQKLPSIIIDICDLKEGFSYIYLPLLASDKLIGIINVGFSNEKDLEDQKIQIIKEIATQITLAVEQTHLRREMELHAVKLEERVRERTFQLESANKELEAFSYSVSHDLRAPLRAVNGYVQILIEDYESILDDEGKRICSVISSSAKQMGQLIDDLLSFSRIGRTNLEPSIVNMEQMAKSIYYELTSENNRNNISFNVENLPDAFVDTMLIRQVWINLISNAIKFSSKRESTVINISGMQQGDEIIYSVKDNGAGFNMKYVEKMFGVFQRLHSVKEFEGTGVGLAIVQRIINRHGGRVWAEGIEDEGATFYFSLRCREENSYE
ncbi:UNVERIFIED_CONTAM: PAS domain S-box-containing protein [Acetivibrio alkalicellulosi]